MFGTFTAESLKNFAEANGFNTKNVDFSEGIFDYKVCERPNKKRYGIPDNNKCNAPNKEVEHGLMDRLKGKLAPYLSEEELINENKRPAEEAKARAEKAKAKKRAELKAKFDSLPPAEKQKIRQKKIDKARFDNELRKNGFEVFPNGKNNMPEQCEKKKASPAECRQAIELYQSQQNSGPTWSGEDFENNRRSVGR